MQPTSSPSVPTGQPSMQPSMEPSCQPTSNPTCPSGQPSSAPTNPTGQPSNQPTGEPTFQPTMQPTTAPTAYVPKPPRLSTYISVGASAGDTILYVRSSLGAAVGMTVVIGPAGDTNAESRTITGFGSIYLDRALTRSWPASTLIRVFAIQEDDSKAPRLTIYQLYNFTYYCHPKHVHGVPSRKFLRFVLWCCGAVVLWCCGAVVLWCCGAVVLWCCGAVVLWCCGAGLAQSRKSFKRVSKGGFFLPTIS